MANMSMKPMNRNDSKLFAETRSVENIIVRTSWPCAVPNPVRNTTPRHPPSGVSPDETVKAVLRFENAYKGARTTIGLQELRAAEQDVVLVIAVDVEWFDSLKESDRLLQEGGRLPGEHRLIDDTGPFEQEDVGGDTRLSLLPDYKGASESNGSDRGGGAHRWTRRRPGEARRSAQ